MKTPDETMIPLDCEIEAPFAGDEVTPVRRVCPDCTSEQAVVENNVEPPDSANEAWGLVRCLGTADWRIFRWCFVLGEVTRPRDGIRTSFDRRKARR